MELDHDHALAIFVAFCRIAACLGLAPGFSSSRIPMRVRLFVSLGLTVALGPLLFPADRPPPRLTTIVDLASAIAMQLFIGFLLGLTSRLLIHALETLMTAASMSIGVTSPFAGHLDGDESLPALTGLIVFAATTLIFVTDQHWLIVHALLDSFDAFPIGMRLDADIALSHVVRTLAFGFPLAFRISAPFLTFGILVNVAFGLVNKAVPQIALYFISAPFALAGGLSLLYLVWSDILSIFISGFSFWVSKS